MELRDLVGRFIQGDQKAFTELVRRYERKVYSIAYRILENHLDADEVTQETFVRIYEKRHEIRDASFFTSLVLRIATNYAIDLLRKKQRRFISVDDETEMMPAVEVEMAALTEAPDFALLNEELATIIDKGIGLLPTRQRVTIILHDVEGYSKTEVAMAMGCPEATVRSNLHVARAKLKKWLAKRIK
ncbi:putative RNA polymerase sigma factor, sigma-70 family [Candidatus Zixiibacteriota bacterium]|nr:putative RNA polymerase sigma factor, sigma-70 family [candidate division Zixibacteria bacterium]